MELIVPPLVICLQHKQNNKDIIDMKKEMTLSANDATEVNVQNVLKSIVNGVKAPLELLRKYYSYVLEREIDMHQTLLLINVQVAFCFTVFPSEGPLLLRAICCGWFLWSVLKCKSALKTK
jgi:hypothetical protein